MRLGPVPLPQLDETSQVETVSEENKNLMWVLLRQLRPGMDLSRVVLPTFVLEPRSFLSKLSDYYYHGDLLSRCTSGRRGPHTPMDRRGRGWGGARMRELKAFFLEVRAPNSVGHAEPSALVWSWPQHYSRYVVNPLAYFWPTWEKRSVSRSSRMRLPLLAK